jgi:hypothetical protein
MPVVLHVTNEPVPLLGRWFGWHIASKQVFNEVEFVLQVDLVEKEGLKSR